MFYESGLLGCLSDHSGAFDLYGFYGRACNSHFFFEMAKSPVCTKNRTLITHISIHVFTLECIYYCIQHSTMAGIAALKAHLSKYHTSGGWQPSKTSKVFLDITIWS